MKKTIPTTLSKILFYIEEDAYGLLSNYLESIKLHFASYPDSQEIVEDIESRVSEQLLENGTKEKVVTIDNVKSLIATMGNVEDFEDGETTSSPMSDIGETKNRSSKKLFRNPDDVMIAGVASGLAAYFGVDPSIMRLLFLLTIFFGGTGIIVYIILWVVLPEAKTSTEKLQMRGEAVTIETLNEVLKKKVQEVKKSNFRLFINKFGEILGKIARVILSVIKNLFGFLLTLASGFGVLALLFFFSILIFNIQSPWIEFPLLDAANQLLAYLGISSLFFFILVPFVFLIALGLRILKQRKIFNSLFVLSLLILWGASLTTLGVVASKLVPEYQRILATDPMYQEVTQEFDLVDFDKIKASNGTRLTVTQSVSQAVSESEEFAVSITGQMRSLEELSLSVSNGELQIDRIEDSKICIFCFLKTPEVHVTLPLLSSIDVENGTRVTIDSLEAEAFEATVSNGSRLSLVINAESLDISGTNASRIDISGTADVAKFNIQNASSVEALELEAREANVRAQNGSRAQVYATENLVLNLQNGSSVKYKGQPEIEKSLQNGSRIEHLDN